MEKIRIQLKDGNYGVKLYNNFTHKDESFVDSIYVSSTSASVNDAVFLQFYKHEYNAEYIKETIFNRFFGFGEYQFVKQGLSKLGDIKSNIDEIFKDDVIENTNFGIGFIRFNINHNVNAYIPLDYFNILTEFDDPYFIPDKFEFIAFDVKKDYYKTLHNDEVAQVIRNTFIRLINPDYCMGYYKDKKCLCSLDNAINAWKPTNGYIHLIEIEQPKTNNDIVTFGLNIYTHRPGVLIGYHGTSISVLEKYMQDLINVYIGDNCKFKLNIKEYSPYNLDYSNLKIGYESFC